MGADVWIAVRPVARDERARDSSAMAGLTASAGLALLLSRSAPRSAAASFSAEMDASGSRTDLAVAIPDRHGETIGALPWSANPSDSVRPDDAGAAGGDD